MPERLGAGTRGRRGSPRRRRAVSGVRRRERFGVLMGALVVVFALEGIARPGPWQQALSATLLAVTLILALAVGEVRPRILRSVAVVSVLLALMVIAEAIAGYGSSRTVIAANLLFVTVAPPAVAVGTLRSLRLHNQVTIEAVFGVLCLYLLLGLFFAFLYALMAKLGGGTLFSGSEAATTARCVYFSFTTLTTVGYGDVTTITNLGHTVSVSEALLGQIYLVTIVSLIVSNLGLRRGPSDGGR